MGAVGGAVGSVQRVLLVSQEYPPDTAWGGIATYAAALAPALARAGLDVHVLSVAPGLPARTEVADGVRVHRRPLRAPRGLGRLTGHPLTVERLTLAWNVARAAARLGPFDVVECPDWKAEGLHLARRGSQPVVVRLHAALADVAPWLGPGDADTQRAARLESAAVRAATLVTGTGEHLAATAGRLDLDPSATAALTCPVEPAPPLPHPAAPVPTVLFTGRFEHRKGPEVLVRAMPTVLARVPDARLVLVGRDSADRDHPSHAAWLAALARSAGVADRVDVRDAWVSRDGVRAALRDAWVCAVPSRWESFGYSAAEAAMAGRPVVASRIGGLSEVVADGVTGLLVDPEDPVGWGQALAAVLADRERARAMGQEAHRRIRARCDPDRVAAATLEAYHRAAARFRAARAA